MREVVVWNFQRQEKRKDSVGQHDYVHHDDDNHHNNHDDDHMVFRFGASLSVYQDVAASARFS